MYTFTKTYEIVLIYNQDETSFRLNNGHLLLFIRFTIITIGLVTRPQRQVVAEQLHNQSRILV
jgi:hypothetical protein